MTKLLHAPGDTLTEGFGPDLATPTLLVTMTLHIAGIAFHVTDGVQRVDELCKTFTDRSQAIAFYRHVRDAAMAGKRIHQIVWEVQALQEAQQAATGRTPEQIAEAINAEVDAHQAQVVIPTHNAVVAAVAEVMAEAEIIHLRREPNPVACGATGPVRVTRVFREVTCQPCIDAEDRRQGRRDDRALTEVMAGTTQAGGWYGARKAAQQAVTPPRTVHPTRTRVHCKPPTPAELDLIRNHRGGVVTTRPGQSWTVLRAIWRRGLGEPVYRPGTRIVASLTLNARGYALAGQQEVAA
jgi:hypothetical protein